MTADTDMTENEAEAIRRGNEALRKVAQEEVRTQQELACELGLPYADIPPEQLPHWAVDAQRLALARRLREAQAPVVDARESPQADDDNAVEAGTRPSQESATKHDAATDIDRTVTSEVTAGSQELSLAEMRVSDAVQGNCGDEPEAAGEGRVTADVTQPTWQSEVGGKRSLWRRVKGIVRGVGRFARDRGLRGRLGNVADQKAEKNRQVRTMFLACAGVLAFSCAAVWLGARSERTRDPQVKVYNNDYRVEPDTLDKQSFQRQYGEKLDALLAHMQGLDQTVGVLTERTQRLQKALDAAQKRSAQQPQEREVSAMPEVSPATPTAEALGTVAGPMTPEEIRRLMKTSDAGAAPRLGVVHVAQTQKEQSVKAGGSGGRKRAWDVPIARNRAGTEAEKTYLPAGSFMRATVLSGVTAPTGGNAAQNPVPMLLAVTDFAQLPNKFRANVQRCFVTASATGDLSSERVWVRLDRLSCMDRNGKAIDVRVQGYATGEDGKTGVRARLVTRSGQAIANALFMGTLSGLGKAVSLSAQSSTTFTSGATGNTVENPWKAGIGSGMNDAMDRIVNYYLKLADKIFPVLELDSGRYVDLVLSQGAAVAIDETPVTPTDHADGNSAEVFGASVRESSAP